MSKAKALLIFICIHTFLNAADIEQPLNGQAARRVTHNNINLTAGSLQMTVIPERMLRTQGDFLTRMVLTVPYGIENGFEQAIAHAVQPHVQSKITYFFDTFMDTVTQNPIPPKAPTSANSDNTTTGANKKLDQIFEKHTALVNITTLVTQKQEMLDKFRKLPASSMAECLKMEIEIKELTSALNILLAKDISMFKEYTQALVKNSN